LLILGQIKKKAELKITKKESFAKKINKVLITFKNAFLKRVENVFLEI
jgi:hypothetical protein